MGNWKKIKKFVFKTSVKAFTLAILWTTAYAMIHTPVLNNEIALEQMTTSNASYLAYNAFQGIKPYLTAMVNVIGVVGVGSIVVEAFNFIKENKGEN